jgi:hypothetical protein
LPFSRSTTTICNPLDLDYSDVRDPASHLSINGNRFYVLFVDAFSRFTWVYPISSKSDVMPVFLKFQTMVERLLINTTHAQDSQSKSESCALQSIRKTSGRTTSPIRNSSADLIR